MDSEKDYSKMGLDTGPQDLDCLKEFAKVLERLEHLAAWQRNRYKMLEYKPHQYYHFRSTTSHLAEFDDMVRQGKETLQDLIKDDQILMKQIYGNS